MNQEISSDMEAESAAMLQRWAVIHNLFESDGPLKVQAILSVAKLSAEEFIGKGMSIGGERLLRQERAARVLLSVADQLLSGPVVQGSALHEEIVGAARELSSYPGVGNGGVG